MDNIIRDEILQIRSSGQVNMLDVLRVQNIANEMGFCELVIFIEEHKSEYWNFILYGE
jgi:hypothetical protein